MKLHRVFHGVQRGEDVTALLALRNLQSGPLLKKRIIGLDARRTYVGPPGKEFPVSHPTLVFRGFDVEDDTDGGPLE